MDKTTTASTRLSFSAMLESHQLALAPKDNELLSEFKARTLVNPPTHEIEVFGCLMSPKRYLVFLDFLVQGTWSECWIYEGPRTHNGYGSFGVGGRQGKDLRAHKLAYILWKGSIEDNLQCLHVKECEFRSCCRPLHLYTGTAKQNTADMMEKGTHKYKIHNFITDTMVQQMKEYHAQGYSLVKIGEFIGVSDETVRQYLSGLTEIRQPRIIRNG